MIHRFASSPLSVLPRSALGSALPLGIGRCLSGCGIGGKLRWPCPLNTITNTKALLFVKRTHGGAPDPSDWTTPQAAVCFQRGGASADLFWQTVKGGGRGSSCRPLPAIGHGQPAHHTAELGNSSQGEKEEVKQCCSRARSLKQGAKHVRGYLTHPALARARRLGLGGSYRLTPKQKQRPKQPPSQSRQPHTCAASAMSIGHHPVPLGPAEPSGVPNPRDMVIMMASTATLPPRGNGTHSHQRQRHLLAPA
jgi:hypothetical protein